MASTLVFRINTDGTVVAMPAVAAAAPATVARDALGFLRDGVQSLFGPADTGVRVGGGRKLLERYVLHQFTPKGSIRYRTSQGCDFTTLLSQRPATEEDVMAAFVASQLDVARNMAAEELATDPTGELFGGASLVALAISGDTVVAQIALFSQDGTSQNLAVPLDVHF